MGGPGDRGGWGDGGGPGDWDGPGGMGGPGGASWFGMGVTLSGAAIADLNSYKNCFFKCVSQIPTGNGGASGNGNGNDNRQRGGGRPGGGFDKTYGACPQLNKFVQIFVCGIANNFYHVILVVIWFHLIH